MFTETERKGMTYYIYYNIYPKNILKSGEQAQATWIYYIKEFSDQVLAPMDQINAFLNEANITREGFNFFSLK